VIRDMGEARGKAIGWCAGQDRRDQNTNKNGNGTGFGFIAGRNASTSNIDTKEKLYYLSQPSTRIAEIKSTW
jgi:hypothetical protein